MRMLVMCAWLVVSLPVMLVLVAVTGVCMGICAAAEWVVDWISTITVMLTRWVEHGQEQG